MKDKEHKYQEGQQVVLVRSKIPYGHITTPNARSLAERHPVQIIDQRQDSAQQLLYKVDAGEFDLIVLEDWLE